MEKNVMLTPLVAMFSLTPFVVENTPVARQWAPGARGEGMHKSMIEAGNAVASKSRRWWDGKAGLRAANNNGWRLHA